ncbi:MAG: phenolic acid decarboxylase subunit B [Candidatus Nitrosocosmicus sp.]|jgi:4-hydroxy-3-polyprenylbenzoate decarboxylase|uniref:UbiX family flavin prenyltransferase n=1 Tax=Candidatus Nitrosocosmicus sp. FF01 TaxID=3397670 RepID=UPI002A6C0CBB|nr:phenolic acid decarboxylase subunit B [Candidatus Nitrosocosmicus sp.]GKS61446.1 putative UbiX-like flavin prenyltransferase [Candidatus Nitrosocosmicus sp.]
MGESLKIVVGISGSSGVIYGIRFLQALSKLKVETHLVLSKWAKKNIEIETDENIGEILKTANYNYDEADMAAAISSGSFRTNGMAIIPCSMKTMSSIANGYDDNLISRAASVTIKENRRLVIVPRETPLSKIHISNMLKLSEIGVIILPAMPGFYHRPSTIEDLIAHIIGKTLDQFEIKNSAFTRWGTEHH